MWVWLMLYECGLCYMSVACTMWVWLMLYECGLQYVGVAYVMWVWFMLCRCGLYCMSVAYVMWCGLCYVCGVCCVGVIISEWVKFVNQSMVYNASKGNPRGVKEKLLWWLKCKVCSVK